MKAARRRPLAEFALGRILKFIERGRIVVELPSGEAIERSGQLAGPRGHIVIHRWRALRRLAIEGDVGFAESYIGG
ncbi:MAG TPA: SAM-dependent methyltransferase, partial [Roseiarcus sp.]|nr:SAM-dependent methyltransferase [Roseiarcus sp.]